MYYENEIIIYIEMGRYQQAIKKIEQFISESPNDGRLLYLMSFCYFQLDEYDVAINYCLDALEKGFSTEECTYLLGKIYVEQDKFVLAEEQFLESLRINAANAAVLSSYGLLMLRTGHDKKALKLINEAMRIDPENEVVLQNKLMYYLFNGNKNAQIGSLQKYVQNASSEVRKLINIGIFDLHNNRMSEARENFKEAFLLDPTNHLILTVLEDLDRQCSPIFLPNRLVTKAGGPAVVWVIFFLFALIAKNFLDETVLSVILLIYILFAVYTWISPLIYNIVLKLKGEANG